MKTTLQKQFLVSLLTFILSLVVFISSAQTIQTFTTSSSWVCPYGVNSITVETWGGGGAGGAAPVNTSVGGGGGGGAYSITTGVPVTFGTTYNYVVGIGGAGNNTGAGVNGNASSFNGTFIANPGTGGGSNASVATGGTGGIGGTFNGGNGASGTIATLRSGGGGGGAGSGGNGGSTLTNAAGTAGAIDGGAGGTGVTSSNNGGNASVAGPGGGGAGALRNSGGGSRIGGNGANGQVRITYTINCTAPPAQPTGLILSPGVNNIMGSFTASAYTDGYIVIRTSTSAAPASPVDGTNYTAGTFALGGFIESVGATTSFNSTSLAATTQYWYWVYGYDNVACVGGIKYLTASPLTGNSTTIACGASTNTVTITSTAGSSYNAGTNTWSFNWSALSWSLGSTPTNCQNVILIVDRTAATAPENININLDINVSIKNFTMRNISNTVHRIVFQIASPTTGAKNIVIDGNCIIECPGGTISNKFNRCSILNNGGTTINGDLSLGRIPTLTASNEGHSSIGSGNADIVTFPNQIFTFYGNMTFNPRGFTVDEHTVFIFDKPGTQYIYNYTRPLTTDTLWPILFEDLRIGVSNSTNLIMAGTMFDGYIEYLGRAGITIGVNSTLDLPANYSMNVIKGGLSAGTGLPSFLKMLAGSKLRLGGNASVPDAFGFVHGVAGSNFPGSISPYVFDPTSTIEYYGSNSMTQTIFNPPTYANLLATNGSGSGRAIKQTIAGTLKINTSFNINALADVYLGTATGLGTNTAPVTSPGPLNINAAGGLFCNANIVSGIGAFTMGNGGYLGMGHIQGISNLGSATGNIQMTGSRSYNTTGNYIYNGILSQVTGGGLPTTINELTIDNPLTVTNSQNVLANGIALLKQGTFDILSTRFTSNGMNGTLNSTGGKMKANLGIVEMKGTSGIAQNLSGSWFVNKTISSLINANTTGITVAPTPADTLLISSALLYGATNSVINTNSNLTLLSRDTATARFGPLGIGNDITGQVTIERFMPAKKSWRLLAAPVANASSPFVSAAWREGGSTPSGYGTRITGPASFIGVDEFTQRASMKYYDGATNVYIDVTNTNTTKIGNTNAGYYVFVRGDRSVAVTGAAIPTILRIKGDIQKGAQTIPVLAGKFATLGNPYPSGINLTTVSKTNISNTYYAWNPNSLGSYNVGAFENYTFDGTNYLKVPGGTIRNIIQSGEAIFIQSNGSAGSVTINETDKVGGVTTPVSRSSTTEARVGVTKPTLEINLYTKDIDSSIYLADGVQIKYDDDYNNAVDNDDVRKILNAGDNIFLKNGEANLIVESRPALKVTDTIKLNLTNTRVNSYRFEIDPSVLNTIGLKATLHDKFFGNQTSVSLSEVTNYNFNITGDLRSKATDRFMITFLRVSPVRFIKIMAERNINNTATVNWYIENENNLHTYIIENSKNGVDYVEVGKQIPTANNFGNPYYSFIHDTPTDVENFYRISAINTDGEEQQSNIATIGKQEISKATVTSIYPNPVIEGKIHINFVNEAAGKYLLSVTNMQGQQVHTESFQINNNLQKTINIGSVATGHYRLIIKNVDGKTKQISFMVK